MGISRHAEIPVVHSDRSEGELGTADQLNPGLPEVQLGFMFEPIIGLVAIVTQLGDRASNRVSMFIYDVPAQRHLCPRDPHTLNFQDPHSGAIFLLLTATSWWGPTLTMSNWLVMIGGGR